jgi:hypothetical protein
MVYGIQAHVFINPPYPLDLSEYTNATSNKIWVQIIPGQNSRPIDVRIRMHFEELTGKFSLATKATFNPTIPIQLVGGIPVTLMTADLIPYLSLENLEVLIGDASEFYRSKRFSEGSYKIWVEVISSRGETLSGNTVGSRFALLVQNDAPQWVSPADNETLTASDPQNILFTWQLGSLVNAVSNIDYQFMIVELPNLNVDKYVAIKSLTPLLVTNTKVTSFRYDYLSPQLIPGRTYAYQVKASSPDGSSMFKNDGYSMVQSFTWGSPCNPPQQVQCTFESYTSEKVSWRPTGSKQLDVAYREVTDTSASEWYTDRVTDNLVDVSNNVYTIINYLKPARMYECKVKSWCGLVSSEFSPVISFKTQSKTEESITKTCGTDMGIPGISTLKRTSIQSLTAGDEIEVGGFKAKLTEVSQNASDTTYTGKCIVYVTTFGIKVASHFSNIKVNIDKKVFAGEIVAEHDPNNLVNPEAVVSDIQSTVGEVNQAMKEFKSLINDAKTYFASDTAFSIIINSLDTVTVIPNGVKVGLETMNEGIKEMQQYKQLVNQGKTAEAEAKLESASAKIENGKQLINLKK